MHGRVADGETAVRKQILRTIVNDDYRGASPEMLSKLKELANSLT
jgi:hypothetical protein